MSKKWGDSDCPAGPPLVTPQAVSPCCTGCSAWPSLPLCRSVIVENSASSTNATEILKPVKKRKRKDYQSPSEEEYESEQMVGQRQGGGVCSQCPGDCGPALCAQISSCCSGLCQLQVQWEMGWPKCQKDLNVWIGGLLALGWWFGVWSTEVWAVPDCPGWAVVLSTLSCSLESGPPK